MFDGVLAPVIIGLVAASLLKVAGKRPDLDAIDERMVLVGTGAADLEGRLQNIDRSLADCVSRSERMTELVSARGENLGASAAALVSAAQEVARVGDTAERAATALASTIPAMAGQMSEIDTLIRKLEADSVQQLRATDALLANIRLRSSEAWAAADMNAAKLTTQIARIDASSKQTTAEIAKRAYALDSAVDSVLERMNAALDETGERAAAQTKELQERLANSRIEVDRIGTDGVRIISQRLDLLLTAAAQLRQTFTMHEEQTARSIEMTEGHLTALPERFGAARQAGEEVFDVLAGRAAVLHAGLADLRTPMTATQSTMVGLGEQLNALRHTADEFGSGLAERLPAASKDIDTLAAGSAELTGRIDGLRAALATSTAATHDLGASVEAARAQTAELGETDARRIAERLVTLTGASAGLARSLAEHGQQSEAARIAVEREIEATEARLSDVIASCGQRSRTMRDGVEQDLATLGAKLAETVDEGGARLWQLGERAITVHNALGGLAQPLDHARATLGTMEAHVDGMRSAIDSFGHEIDARLPAATFGLHDLTQNAASLVDHIGELQATIVEGSSSIAEVSKGFAREHSRLAGATDALVTQFDRARAELGQLRDEAAAAADDAAGRLGPTFTRARELAQHSADALRAMLDGVVDDTGRALDRVGSSTAETAFGAPIRIQLAAIEDAAGRAAITADSAAKRIAGQARVLDTTIDGVDAKVAEIETRLDVRARDTLSARSTRLIMMLNEASVDIARLLAIDAGEKAWVRYLKGDHGIFARLAAKLVDRESTRKIARHYEHDAAFQEEASRYLDIFEQLTGRLLSDPDGEALTATMVSSDLGKLYVIIARAVGRWSPTA